MLFNSFTFLLFFPLFYVAYLGLQGRLRTQNLLVLVGSYFFYGWWDWRFLGLIVLSTLIDFFVGRELEKRDEGGQHRMTRKHLVSLSVVANLSILGVFKYFDFFSESFVQILNMVGFQADPLTLRVVLPVGISFYTFQTMSYTIDVYRRRMKPTRSLLDFAVFVAFFPQLVAGPIERASHLLPQVAKPRKLNPDALSAGLFLIVYGYFQKVFIADGVARVANQVFGNHTTYQGLDLFLAVLAFAVQIYGDFAGYSKIARGLGRLMGFEIMVNFRLPYFALNPSDFWRRWHISLSSWLRDYLYISLGGNRGGASRTYRNLMLTMLLGGLWHGAAWNFVIWGAFHGAILMLYRALAPLAIQRPHLGRWLESGGGTLFRWSVMFCLTLVGWLVFRAESAGQILYFIQNVSLAPGARTSEFVQTLFFFSWPLLVVEPIQHVTKDLLAPARLPWPLLAGMYAVMVFMILGFGNLDASEFIYFQF